MRYRAAAGTGGHLTVDGVEPEHPLQGPTGVETVRLLTERIERVATTRRLVVYLAMIGPVVLLTLLPTGVIYDNEEVAFFRAVVTVDPGPQSQDVVAYAPSITRFLADQVFAGSVALLGFEPAIAMWRIALAGLISTGLAFLARSLRVSAPAAALAVAVFVLMKQTLLGDETVFDAVEAKALAYTLVFPALSLYVNRRYLAADVMLAAATYFHLLVGGFWMLFLLAFRWVDDGSVRAVARSAVRYGLLVMPLAIATVLEQTGSSGVDTAGALIREIYAVERNPHHVAPFVNKYEFWEWTPGIVLALSLAAGLLLARNDAHARPVRPIMTTLLLGYLYLAVALVLAWVDRDSHYLGRFFMFRPSSLLFLLSIAVLLGWLEKQFQRPAGSLLVVAAVLLPPMLWSQAKERIEQYAWDTELTAEIVALAEAARQRSEPTDLVMLHPSLDMGWPEITLPRLLQRPTYVNRKFMQQTPNGILEWSRRMAAREALVSRGCDSGVAPVGFKLLLLPAAERSGATADCGPVVWSSDNYVIRRRAE